MSHGAAVCHLLQFRTQQQNLIYANIQLYI